MNSPLRLTAQAVAKFPGVIAEEVARREKAFVAQSLSEIMVGRIPQYLNDDSRHLTRNLLSRSLQSIGRTEIVFEDQWKTRIFIEPHSAEPAIRALDQFLIEKTRREDQSRTEFGTIEGNVLSTSTYYGKPAVVLRDRLSGLDVTCIFSPELVARVGASHTWAEVWNSRRVLVTGEISYRKDGRIQQVLALDIEDVDPRPLRYSDIARPGLTGGLSPSEYIDAQWEDEIG